ncbi:hypothetical protein [Spiroplasma monobiae]|uniref:Uncharacterized protein n=1 Tax=Spiroplasma monobiae MQ-1 TaxID=1336748 RepID=A0A2K9LU09_SPISQ|nr:hypothetical protein [Spiroplasma monobiae]AUM62548.1 hypothetical protein SMONO_v1c02990 [Spiroplasma monobiae MQ-1]
MTNKKSKVVNRVPKMKILEDAKLGINTINSLSGKIGSTPIKNTSDTPEVHQAVQKMQIRQMNPNDEKRTDSRTRHIEKVRNKTQVINEKLSILEQRKLGYVSNKKLDYEKELERKRLESKRKVKKSLFQNDDYVKMNQQAANLFSQDILVKSKIKDTKDNLKGRNQKVSDLKSMFDTSSSSKISFKSNNNVVNTKRITKILGDIPFGSESTEFFLKAQEKQNQRIFSSPLDDYKVEKEEKLELEEQIDLKEDILEQINQEEIIDLKTINQMAKKYQQDAEKIRKELEKQNDKKLSSYDISSIYNRILGSAKTTKISRVEKPRLEGNTSTGIDISKRPSIAFEKK